MEPKTIESENKEMKIGSKEILLSVKKEEKMIKNDDDTDDNYDGYEDEFENEETNSQMNLKDCDMNMEDKENLKKDIQRKKGVKIDDIDDTFFTFNEELAVNRIIEHRIKNEIRKKKEFALWKFKKDLENKLNEENNVRKFIIQIYFDVYSIVFCATL